MYVLYLASIIATSPTLPSFSNPLPGTSQAPLNPATLTFEQALANATAELKTLVQTEVANLSNLLSIDINSVTKHYTGLVDRSYNDLTTYIRTLRSAIPTATTPQTSPSAAPFPGNINDWSGVFAAIMTNAKCGNCCTCMAGEYCIFTLYSEIKSILGKYPEFQPTFLSTPVGQGNVAVLEIILRKVGEKRCKNCPICVAICQDLRLAFIFGGFPNLLGGNQGMFGPLLLGLGGNTSNLPLPFLLALMKQMEPATVLPDAKGCPSSYGGAGNLVARGQNANAVCPSQLVPQPTIVAPNPSYSQQPVCPSAAQPIQSACPSATQPISTGYQRPGPAYGVQGSQNAAQNSSPAVKQASAYGKGYGVSYN